MCALDSFNNGDFGGILFTFLVSEFGFCQFLFSECIVVVVVATCNLLDEITSLLVYSFALLRQFIFSQVYCLCVGSMENAIAIVETET